MIGSRSLAMRLLVAAAAAAPVLGVAPAQEIAFTAGARGGPEEVTGSCLVTAGNAQSGGYGYALVDVHNGGGEAHAVRFELQSSRSDGVRRTVRLAAGERARIVLPLPCQHPDLRSSVAVDGHVGEALPLRAYSRSPRAALVVTADAGLGSRWQGGLGPLHATRGSTGWDVTVRRPDELPDTWTWLSGFDVIVADAATVTATEHQQLLVRYAAGGGALLVVRPEEAASGSSLARLQEHPFAAPAPPPQLPPVPRARRPTTMMRTGVVEPPAGGNDAEEERRAAERAAAAAASPLRYGRLGAGVHAVMPGDGVTALGTDPRLEAWLGDSRPEPRFAYRVGQLPWSGVPSIPGLGDVPVRLFLVLMLAFVVWVGMQAHRHTRRRRQPLRLLVTIPAAGFGCTGLVLVWGLVGEGLHVRGAVRSLTWLDQRAHEAVVCAQESLYAGRGPDALPLRAGTALYSPLLNGQTTAPHRLGIDLDGGVTLAGAALPSRTLTPLVTVSQRTLRERLRFRREGNGLHVLQGSDLALVPGNDALVLRDFEGRWYVANGDGALQPIADADAAGRVEAVTQWFRTFEVSMGARPIGRAAEAEQLLPGSYLARVREQPGLDPLGLRTTWEVEQHLVIGRLAPEDFVE